VSTNYVDTLCRVSATLMSCITLHCLYTRVRRCVYIFTYVHNGQESKSDILQGKMPQGRAFEHLLRPKMHLRSNKYPKPRLGSLQRSPVSLTGGDGEGARCFLPKNLFMDMLRRFINCRIIISARQHICYSALYVIARPSVCPSHGWISQRRLKL